MTKIQHLLTEYDKWVEKPPRAWFEYALNSMYDEGKYDKEFTPTKTDKTTEV